MDEAEGTLAGAGAGRALVTINAILFLTFLDTTIMSVALADVQSSAARRRISACSGWSTATPSCSPA